MPHQHSNTLTLKHFERFGYRLEDYFRPNSVGKCVEMCAVALSSLLGKRQRERAFWNILVGLERLFWKVLTQFRLLMSFAARTVENGNITAAVMDYQ